MRQQEILVEEGAQAFSRGEAITAHNYRANWKIALFAKGYKQAEQDAVTWEAKKRHKTPEEVKETRTRLQVLKRALSN